jgi:hypothetical protein
MHINEFGFATHKEGVGTKAGGFDEVGGILFGDLRGDGDGWLDGYCGVIVIYRTRWIYRKIESALSSRKLKTQIFATTQHHFVYHSESNNKIKTQMKLVT